ncbi:MAG TPA: MarR family transcriptional regulator [Phnomibacter sp.]|nr:MarR family transcriptional regulator [Phnomibacter sp.]
MSIEQDIKQPSFRNVYQKALINLIFTHNYVTEKFRSLLEQHGLTPQQYNILRILRGAGGPLSTLQIRSRMLDKMSDTSRLVDRLIAKGLVSKNLCAKDKRLVDIQITPAGLKLLKTLDAFDKKLDEIMANLTEEEARQFSDLLDKIRAGSTSTCGIHHSPK